MQSIRGDIPVWSSAVQRQMKAGPPGSDKADIHLDFPTSTIRHSGVSRCLVTYSAGAYRCTYWRQNVLLNASTLMLGLG